MKKILYSVLAVAALASCVKSEAVYTEDNSEIKIKPATALATKANQLAAIDGTEYPVAENFDVYGYWANLPAGNSFTKADADVTTYLGEGGAVEFTNKGNYWGGTTTYYWPKNGSLRFAAYSPSSVDMLHDLATDTYTVDGYVQPNETAKTWDLLVAPTSKSYTSMTAAENVSVVFEHALSWITVKVVAKDAEAAKAFDLKKVTINNVVTTADLAAVMSGADKAINWTLSETVAPVVVFEGSQAVTETATVIETTKDGTVIIPQPTTTITVDYKQNALEGTPALDNQQVTVDLVLDAENTPWKPGKHYVYTLVFGLDEILINPDVVDWDDVIVNEVQVGKTTVYSANQLAEALTADAENIEVVLFEDIDLPISSLGQQTGGSGEYKLGSENTKNITIDLNGKTLNVTTTYWSNLGAKNADAVFTIKNGTMTSSQATGTWNSYDLCFSNCNYVIEDVVFEKAIALEGKNYTLKNVTINETHDYYAMWISAKGQNVTIDGLTVNSDGRGIKIDEQYVNESLAKVTLNVANATFKTAKKAAILVKSAAGATINLDNVNIEGVAADKDFAVWVDADAAAYADKVVVEGGLCRLESSEKVADGVLLNAAGEYEIFSANGLFWFANEVNVSKNSFAGKTVKLVADIDLVNAAWTPVGQTGATTFNGVFDGQNYTVSNLNVDSEAQTGANYSSGLFGWVESHTAGNGHLKNVNIAGAVVNGHHNCGALVGYITEKNALVENCHVTGATITCTMANDDANGDKAGALIGNATNATLVKDCTAADSTVSAGRDAGQVIGAGKAANVTGCSATDVTVSANGTSTGANVRNEVIGRLL